MGVQGYDDRLPDYSPTGHAARADLVRHTLTEVDQALSKVTEPTAHDRLAAAVMRERLEVQLRHGGDFSLLDWHRRALDLGSMGLDPLRSELTLL